MNLSTSLESVKGVGPKTAAQLEAAGLQTVGDLVRFWPRRHEDYSDVATIAEITPGKRTIVATVEKTEIKRVRRGMTVTTAVLADGTGKLQATWFNQPYRATQFKDGVEYVFSGEFEFRYNRYQLTNPSSELAEDVKNNDKAGLIPVYRQVKGLKTQIVRKLLLEIKPLITVLPEQLPESVVKNAGLISYADAVMKIHFPSSPEDIKEARERLSFDELFGLVLASQRNKQEAKSLPGQVVAFDAQAVQTFVRDLPFELTTAQRVAAWEIIQDMQRDTPMNRLLQGDVGSGKTVVAGIAALVTARQGIQTAVMAPTELLARQHAKSLAALLEPFGVTVGLLVGGIKSTQRQSLLEGIEKGSVAVVVGTHALIQDAVDFYNLGFAVIDEQHRFGVAQRQQLLAKGHTMPHLLAMTATPIPRSLQLTVFGELAVSVLGELPKNRQPILTKIVSPISAKTTYASIDAQIAKGRQVYIVCSLIDDGGSEKKSVEAEYKKLKNSLFGHRTMAMLHGKMPADEKDALMNSFAAGEIDILVSTTVIEVGVDVPNATVMMIEDADMFGLAQLHQLRGRVGRGEHQSFCYLMMSDTSKPSQRLKEIEQSSDGFHLAEIDLQLRGPGQIYGRAQHGALNLEIATLGDTRLTKRVHQAVEQFILSNESLEKYPRLAEQVSYYQRLTTLN